MKNNLRRFLAGDLLFHVEMRVANAFNRTLDRHPSSKPFLSGDTYLSFADIKLNGIHDIKKIKSGDIVFVSSQDLKNFKYDIFPSIDTEFTLITHHGDESVTNEFLDIANHPKLKNWFAQNNELQHPKITAIPIGLEDAWRHNNGVVRDFKKLIQKPVCKRPQILYGFNVLTNPRARSQALNILSQSKLAVRVDASSRKYRETLNQYMFVASPPGNGIDCHRTWEALYLKTIPIVVGVDFYDQFGEFPGLVINSWDELMSFDEKKLIKIYREKIDMLSNYELIWESYWRKLISKSRINPTL